MKERCPLESVCRESWRDFTYDLDKDCLRKALRQIPLEVRELTREKMDRLFLYPIVV